MSEQQIRQSAMVVIHELSWKVVQLSDQYSRIISTEGYTQSAKDAIDQAWHIFNLRNQLLPIFSIQLEEINSP